MVMFFFIIKEKLIFFQSLTECRVRGCNGMPEGQACGVPHCQ